MKKLLMISATAVLFSTACKKDYNCECKASAEYDDNSGVSGSITLETTESIKDTKKKAQTKCDDIKSTLESDFSDATTKSITCTLK